MDTKAYLESIVEHWQPITIVLASVVVTYFVIVFVRALLNRRHLLRRDMVWLEITPPASIAKTPEATEQLFSVIHGARAARAIKERLYDRSPVMSFEIVSTRKDGIRYLLQVEKSRSKNIQKAITSYIPDSKVKEIERAASDADKVA